MNRYVKRPLTVAVCVAILPVSAVCQESSAQRTAEIGGGHQVVSDFSGDMLAQLSGCLQQLASKVCPAVVQIEVSGFGPAGNDNHKDTALVVRQHAIGSGVIVDPDGYIMTNAHVVAGARKSSLARLRIAQAPRVNSIRAQCRVLLNQRQFTAT